MLSPRRKVKALLAQFDDSDSESEQRNVAKNSIGSTEPLDAAEKIEDTRGLLCDSPSINTIAGPMSSKNMRSAVSKASLVAHMKEKDANETAQDRDSRTAGNSAADAYTRMRQQMGLGKDPQEVRGLHTPGRESDVDELQNAPADDDNLPSGASSPRIIIEQDGTRSPSPLFFSSPAGDDSQSGPSSKRSNQLSDWNGSSIDARTHPDSKFNALVEKHRRLRLAREAAEETKRIERLAQLKNAASKSSCNVGRAAFSDSTDESDMSDGGVGRRMTQAPRPARKASRKAMVEMHRETQRINRNMQLAHQAKTNKMITKESLLAKFDFLSTPSAAMKPQNEPENEPAASSSITSAMASDTEAARKEATPPTSPLLPIAKAPFTVRAMTPETQKTDAAADRPDLPRTRKRIPLAEVTRDPAAIARREGNSWGPSALVKGSTQTPALDSGEGSDSDLEIVQQQPEPKKLAAFERLPPKKSREKSSHLILRTLANLPSASPTAKDISITAATMETQLTKAARRQAHQEREEKLKELRAKGIYIPDEEERLKEQQEVEDLVEQERQKNVEIRRMERKAAKQDGTYVEETLLDAESEDDEDCESQEASSLDDAVSGSEQEEDNASDEEGQASEGHSEKASLHTEHRPPGPESSGINGAQGVFGHENQTIEDDDVVGDDSCAEEKSGKDRMVSTSVSGVVRQSMRSRRPIIDSDDDENGDDAAEKPKAAKLPSPVGETPRSAPRSARRTIPGLQMSDDLPMGLTQAFAATMAEAGTQEEHVTSPEIHRSLSTREMPSPACVAATGLRRLDSVDIVTDSQPATQNQIAQLVPSLSSIQEPSHPPAETSATQTSFVPTQDVGCVMSPFKDSRFDSPAVEVHSTVDTALLAPQTPPARQSMSRLRRGRNPENMDDQARATAVGEPDAAAAKVSPQCSFTTLKGGARKVSKAAAFDKTTSIAKDAVDEAAEESEDEYAGLGGVSEDEDGEEEREADRAMIDYDEGVGHGDEGKLAGFYA